MGDRVSGYGVSTALKDDEFRIECADKSFGFGPDIEEISIVCTGSHRQIQFGAFCSSSACFISETRTGIEVGTILVEIDNT